MQNFTSKTIIMRLNNSLHCSTLINLYINLPYSDKLLQIHNSKPQARRYNFMFILKYQL